MTFYGDPSVSKLVEFDMKELLIYNEKASHV